MIEIQSWPFLVGCNQYFDYKAIVAPRFICQLKLSSLLAKVTSGEITETGLAYYREIYTSKVGDCTLIFRVIEATHENTGIQGFGALKDAFGREIVLIEGMLFEGIHKNIKITQDEIEKVHQYLIVFYQDFWYSATNQPAIPSEPYQLLEHTGEHNTLQYIILENYYDNFKKPHNTHNIDSDNYSWESQLFGKCNNSVDSVAFLFNERTIIYRYDRTVVASKLDEKIDRQLYVGRKCIQDCPSPIVISPNGNFIATGMIEKFDRNIVKVWYLENIWNSNTNKVLEPILDIEPFGYGPIGNSVFGRIYTLAFSPDSENLIFAGQEGIIYIWDMKSGSKLEERHEHSNSIGALAISPNNKYLISGDKDGVISFWDWPNRQIINSIYTNLPIRSLAFSPDSKIFTSGGDNGEVKIWKSENREEIALLGEHSEPINSIIFSPDAKTIASASDDCTIKIWDILKRREIAVLTGHSKEVNSIAFSSDGLTIASASQDKTIILWTKK